LFAVQLLDEDTAYKVKFKMPVKNDAFIGVGSLSPDAASSKELYRGILLVFIVHRLL